MSPPAPNFGKFLDQGGGSSATLLAGRPFHFEYESMFLKFLIVADIPATLALVPLSLALLPFWKFVGFYPSSYVTAVVLLISASCQWLLIGRQIDHWLVRKRWGDWLHQHIRRSFRFLVAAIIITTLILTPLVSYRSRRLGFRHAGISFGRR